jgi:hypothetical protein
MSARLAHGLVRASGIILCSLAMEPGGPRGPAGSPGLFQVINSRFIGGDSDGSRIPIAAEAAPATGLASGQRQLTRLRLPVGASGCRAAAPTLSRSGMFNKCHQNFGNFKPKAPCLWCAIERAFCANFALHDLARGAFRSAGCTATYVSTTGET